MSFFISLIRPLTAGHRASRAVLLGFLPVWVAASPGCSRIPIGTVKTIEIALTVGRTARGNVLDDQRLEATVSVETNQIYEIHAGLLESFVDTGGLGGTTGVVTGVPLAEDVSFVVGAFTGGGISGTAPVATFIPEVDGDVTIQFTYAPPDPSDTASGLVGILRGAILGTRYATYELLVSEIGFDDNGTSPMSAVELAIGTEGERTGTLSVGDAADFFRVQVRAGTTYRLNLEATDAVEVTSGGEDRFGQVNFGAATASGLVITGSASGGSPGVSEFTAPADEEVHLRLTVDGSGTGVPTASASTAIEYALSVVEVLPEGG